MKDQAKDEKLEDMVTDLDPPYETIEDLRIGRLLDQYGIPFFYRQATVVYDRGKNQIWYPTFTLVPYDGLVIDCVRDSGRGPHDPIQQRKQAYGHNQIPAVVLNPADMKQPNWGRRLYGQIQQAYRHHGEQMGYTPSREYDPNRLALGSTPYLGTPGRQ